LIQLETHLQQDFGFENALRNLGRPARIDADRAEENGIVGRQFLERAESGSVIWFSR
jgi:hypothetical protein